MLEGKDRDLQAAINNTVFRVHQAMEGFIHNMNAIHSRGGNQVVYSSINYGTDTSPEGRCIIREVLLCTEQGVGYNETPAFPIQIWKKKRGVNYLPEDKNYDLYKLACKVVSKRQIPNFLNLDATFNQNDAWKENDNNRFQYECATMGSRIRVLEDRHGEKTSIGRGNLSITTINLPKIAIESSYEAQEKVGIEFELGKGSQQFITASYKKIVKKIFWQKLEKYAEIVAKQLYERYCFQCTAIAKQFPLLMSGLWVESEKLKPFDKVEPVLKHGSLCIGFVGLAECLTALTGKHHGESKEAQELGLEIIRNLEEIAEQSSERYNLNYAILATPSKKIEEKLSSNYLYRLGIVTVIALIFHNIPEGITTFLSSSHDLSLGVTLSLGIALHNIPEGISVAVPIYFATGNRKKAIVFTFISGFSEMIGAVLAYLFLAPFITNFVLGIILSMAAGIMIHISIYELLPSSFKYPLNAKVLLFFLIGFFVMFLCHFFI